MSGEVIDLALSNPSGNPCLRAVEETVVVELAASAAMDVAGVRCILI